MPCSSASQDKETEVVFSVGTTTVLGGLMTQGPPAGAIFTG